jgi:hypothetical protein
MNGSRMQRPRWRRRVVAGLAFASVVSPLVGSAVPAFAQTVPPVPLPPIPLPPIPTPPLPPAPPQAQPVLEVIGPAASPVCDNATVAAILVPALGLPPALGAGLSYLAGGFFIVCGAIPAPGKFVTCPLDTQGHELLTKAYGLLTLITFRPFAAVVGETFMLQDKLPPPANTAPLAATGAAALSCEVVDATVPTSPPGDETSDETAPSASGDFATDFRFFEPDGGLARDLFGPGSVLPGGEESLFASSAAAASTRGRIGFAYPIVFLLPLALMVLGVYLGWVLMRPIRTRADD